MREGERDRERKQERGVHKRRNKKQWLSQEKQVAKGQDQQKNDYSLYTFLYFLYFIPCKCISYSVCVCVYTQSCLTLCDPMDYILPLFATPWTVSCLGPLFMEFSRQEYWSGLPFPTLGDLPDPGIKPKSSSSPALVSRFFTTVPPGKHRESPKGSTQKGSHH